MKTIKITWIGCHSEGETAFQALLEKGYKVTNFITLNDESFLRRSSGSRVYINLCERYNIPISLISTIKNDESYEIIKAANPDLLIVLGWSEILPERLLSIPTIGTVGAHAAMLPHNRGSAPINWALIKDEKSCGRKIYNIHFLIIYSVVYVVLCLLCLFVYPYALIRYFLLVVMLVVMIVKRHKIIQIMKIK